MNNPYFGTVPWGNMRIVDDLVKLTRPRTRTEIEKDLTWLAGIEGRMHASDDTRV